MPALSAHCKVCSFLHLPSLPVEILGLTGVPSAGENFVAVENETRAREISEFRQRKAREKVSAAAVAVAIGSEGAAVAAQHKTAHADPRQTISPAASGRARRSGAGAAAGADRAGVDVMQPASARRRRERVGGPAAARAARGARRRARAMAAVAADEQRRRGPVDRRRRGRAARARRAL
jgi:hypothetical protein